MNFLWDTDDTVSPVVPTSSGMTFVHDKQTPSIQQAANR